MLALITKIVITMKFVMGRWAVYVTDREHKTYG